MKEHLEDFLIESVNVALEGSIEALPIEIQEIRDIDLTVP